MKLPDFIADLIGALSIFAMAYAVIVIGHGMGL